MEEVREILKNAEKKVVRCLRYDRRCHNYVQEEHLIIHTKDDLEGLVEKTVKEMSRKGAIFNGKFEDLPAGERQKLYNEALEKALKWWEILCEECGKPINLFKTKYFKVECLEEEYCEVCGEDKHYEPDKEITDEFLAKAIEKGKPTYKLVDDVAIVLAGKERELLFTKEYPLSAKALEKFGKAWRG